jgi:hypothetical protein
MNRKENDRESPFVNAARHEMTPVEHSTHPGDDRLLSALDGELASEERSALHAHLATCEECRARWTTWKARFRNEVSSLSSTAGVPNLQDYIRTRQPEASSGGGWLRQLASRRSTVGLAAAAATLAVVVAVAIPLVWTPSLRTEEQVRALSSRITDLQNQIDISSGFGLPINNDLAGGLITEMLLHAYDWTDWAAYEVEVGDDWLLIAETQLGNADLWPLLWVLNAERAQDGPLTPGETVWLPKPHE